MAYRCDICDKGIVAGRTGTHHRGVAGKRWRKRAPKTIRLFKPNLQSASFTISGERIKMKVCAKCVKRLKKDQIDSGMVASL
mgnify:CR=1